MAQADGLRAVLDLLRVMESSAPNAVCSIHAGSDQEIIMRWAWTKNGEKKELLRSVIVPLFERNNYSILQVIEECGKLITRDQDAPQ